jgi:putative tryptophan/tyrosine transport system substrate-binding protein
VRRQDFITLIGSAALAGSRPARAQQPAKVHRVAYVMTVGSVAEVRESMRAVVFFEEMRRLGYVEGGDLAVEIFSGEGKEEGYAALARHVVQLKPDLIFARDVPMVLHLQLATATIPVVAVTADPASVGIASSLARPGANITGVSVDAGSEIWGKRLELLKEAVPGLSRVSFLGTRNSWDSSVGWQARKAAMNMGFALLGSFPEWPPLEEAVYRRLFASMAQEGVDAILISDNSENLENRRLIVELAEEARLPTMSPFRELVELGGLMAYAPDYRELYRHAARQIYQILKGAQPAEDCAGTDIRGRL